MCVCVCYVHVYKYVKINRAARACETDDDGSCGESESEENHSTGMWSSDQRRENSGNIIYKTSQELLLLLPRVLPHYTTPSWLYGFFLTQWKCYRLFFFFLSSLLYILAHRSVRSCVCVCVFIMCACECSSLYAALVESIYCFVSFFFFF